MKPDAPAGRGSRLLTDWVLRCLAAYGSDVHLEAEGRWNVRVGGPLVRVLGKESLTVLSARTEKAGTGSKPGEVLSWDGDVTQRLAAFIRTQGQASELWLDGLDEEAGRAIVASRLELEGVKFEVRAGKLVRRPLLVYNFKVRWQGSEGREELRSVTFDPATGGARETPPTDQEHIAPAPARRPPAGAALPVQEGFARARQILVPAIEAKLRQRSQRARTSASDEEARLNAYYSQLLHEEKSGGQRRGQRRSQERAEQLKREWRQKLEALGRTVEEARFSLFSAAVLWAPWLSVEVAVLGRPRILRTTWVDLHLRRWDGLTCDACGQPHTWLRRDGAKLVGRDCPPPADGKPATRKAEPTRATHGRKGA